MDQLISLDTQLLIFLNNHYTPFLDTFFWNISRSTTWIPLYLSLVIALCTQVYYNVKGYATVLGCGYDSATNSPSKVEGGRGACASPAVIKNTALLSLIFIAAIAITVGLADYISSGIIKHAVCRLRPTQNPAVEPLLHIVNGYHGGRYGFVSSHAANTFALTLLFSLIYTRLTNRYATNSPSKIEGDRGRVHHLQKNNGYATFQLTANILTLVLFTLLNCYSRMYLGVHYPGDILGGLIVATILALTIYYLLSYLLTRYILPKLTEDATAWDAGVPPAVNKLTAALPTLTFLLTLIYCCF